MKERITFNLEKDRFLNLRRGALARTAMVETARNVAKDLRNSTDMSRRDLDRGWVDGLLGMVGRLPSPVRRLAFLGVVTGTIGLVLAACDEDNTPPDGQGEPNEPTAERLDPHRLIFPFPENPNMQVQQAWNYSRGLTGFHGGIDFIQGVVRQSSTWQSFPVLAAIDGKVCKNPRSRQGEAVLEESTLADGTQLETYYGHLKKDSIDPKIPDCYVEPPVEVHQGDVIAMAGATGVKGKNDKGVEVDQPTWIHLHFQVKKKIEKSKVLVDPYDLRGIAEDYPDPNFTNGKVCGPNFLWQTCPLVLGTTVGTPAPTPSTPTSVAIEDEPGCPEREGEPACAPDFELTSIDGRRVKLSDFKGQPVVIVYLADECDNTCVEYLEDIIVLFERYQSRGLVVLGIITEENFYNEEGMAVVKQKIPTVLVDEKLQDESGENYYKVGKLYGKPFALSTFVIARDGVFRSWAITRITMNSWEEILENSTSQP